MKVAVIGSGISGLAATWFLSKHHDVTLCERNHGVGMDAHSISLATYSGTVHLNAPMRVFFEGYYPTLTQLYREADVAYEPIKYSGSFSQLGERAYFQYRNYWFGNRTLPFLAGRSTWLPSAWRLGWDLLRLLRQVQAPENHLLADSESLEAFLNRHGYRTLGEDFLYPTFAGICTCSYDQIKAYPASIILGYLARDLTWSRVNRLTHGTREVAESLANAATHRRYGVQLKAVCEQQDSVVITDGDAYQESFDQVVIATQANQARALLPEVMHAERALLSQFDYQQSRLVIHRDERLMPERRRDWSPVNYLLSPDQPMPMASIWMNSIYPELADQPPVFETWNPFEQLVPEERLIDASVERPIPTAKSLAALAELHALQSAPYRRIWFCGSYAERGIPLLESAVASAKRISDQLIPS